MRLILTAIVANLLLAGTIFGGTINVPADYPTIQGAIDASSNGDVINIAAGTYNEANLNPGGKAITIQGTLNGDGSLATTIDAQQNGNVFTIVSGEDNGTLIQSLSITGGENASLDAGGIYCNQSSPTISGCTIFGNTANNRGGGISCYNNSNPIITDCTISGNTAKEGGGVHYNNSNGTIINCTIEANSADSEDNSGYGGGIHCYNNASPTINGCTIEINSADSGGGIYCVASNPMIQNCLIKNNVATDAGGGLYCTMNSSPTVVECIIRGNNIAGPPQDILNMTGYSQFFGQMNGPSDQGFLAAAMVLDLIGYDISLGDHPNIPPAYVSEDGVSFRRQIPIYLEPRLNALGGANARTQSEIDNTSFDDLINAASNGLFGFYSEIIEYGVNNQEWYQAGGAPPTRADLAMMVQAYENNINSIGGSITTEQAREAFTYALYETLYKTDGNIPGFSEYGQMLLDGYVLSGFPLGIEQAKSGAGIYAMEDCNPELTNSFVCGNDPDQIAGNWTDNGGNIVSTSCPVFDGVCCTNEICLSSVEDDCLYWGGEWLGLNASCDECPVTVTPDPMGACCHNGGCIIATELECAIAGGNYAGDDTTCIDANCPTTCIGDANGDGEVSVNDILLVISQFGVTCP